MSPPGPTAPHRRRSTTRSATRIALTGGRLIDGRSDEVRDATVVFDDERILEIRPAVDSSRTHATFDDAVDVIDVEGALIAPGLIDLHGDAFERSLMPRGRVYAPLDVALQDNRTQLAAAGISTSYLAATDSWEPGLRSRAMLRDLVEHLAAQVPGSEVRLHVRHETTATEGFDELAAWIRAGAVSMLSFGDHTPGGIRGVSGDPSPTLVDRSGTERDTLRELIRAAVDRRHEGQAQNERLAGLAQSVRCPTASHDGGSLDDVYRDALLPVTLAEFPMSAEVAGSYREAGIRIILGAPNLVRGGSHLGNLSVADALRIEQGDVLCSDYHYPSLLQAPFAAAARGLAPLAVAWRAVSSSPAEAAGLQDRGVLEPGRRADVVVVDDRATPRAVQLYVAGRCVYSTGARG